MISTGDLGLDECLDGGYQQGALHLVIGSPGSGKSSWLRMAIRSALNAGKTVHAVDLEGSIGKHFRGEPGFSVTTRLRPLQDQSRIDLLVYDDAQLDIQSYQGALPEWLSGHFIPDLQRLEHPAKLVSWQSRSPETNPRVSAIVPKALNFSADVILRLHRDEHVRGLRAVLQKNRFGLTGREFGYALPDLRPIVRRTFWERLQEEPV